jgi:hypothetical protein
MSRQWAFVMMADKLQISDRDRRDIEIIARNAERLNHEVLDTLEYQHLPFPRKSRFCSQQ